MEGEPKVKQLLGGRGHISEELQAQAKKIESPVVNELLIAARKGQTLLVLNILAEGGGAEPSSIVDKHGRNCLQLACLHGQYETVLSILHQSRMDVSATNKRGLTALHDACTEGHINIALLLISIGVSVHSRTNDGWTPLMCASSNGHVQLASLLIAASCDINAITSMGLSALHIAAWKGQAPVVDMLVHSGCNVQAQSNNGKTALDLAQEERQIECIRILQTATSKEDELENARRKLKALDEKVSELQMLLKKSTSPRLLTETCATPPLTNFKLKKTDLLKNEAPRSASSNDLVALQGQYKNAKKSSKKLSPETTPNTPQKRQSIDSSNEKRGSIEKHSITELVAESLKNPASIASIRQELKADNLTPRIQRKLKNPTNHQTTLPSLSNDSSPPPAGQSNSLTSSPLSSPKTRPRWTDNPLKDSAL